MALGDLFKSKKKHEKEQSKKRREPVPDAKNAADVVNRALICQKRGDLDGAIILYKEAERICREFGDKAILQVSLAKQAEILHARGDLDGAMALHKEEERICRELDDKGSLGRSLGNQAAILSAQGDLDGAMALYKEAERIFRELGNPQGLVISLLNEAYVLGEQARGQDTLDLVEEAHALAVDNALAGLAQRAAELLALLRAWLAKQAMILKTKGDLGGLMALYKKEERICRQLGDEIILGKSLCGQAQAVETGSDLAGGTAVYEEAECIFRKLGDSEGLAISLVNQGHMLVQQGRGQDALSLVEEAHALAVEHGLTGLAREIEALLAMLRTRSGSAMPQQPDNEPCEEKLAQKRLRGDNNGTR